MGCCKKLVRDEIVEREKSEASVNDTNVVENDTHFQRNTRAGRSKDRRNSNQYGNNNKNSNSRGRPRDRKRRL